MLQVRDHVLQMVRVRSENLTTRRIGHLRMPRKVVMNPQFQEEIEQHVTSLVLF